MPSSPIRVQGGRLHTRQASRDAIAVGAWVTALCLAVAAITIAASLTAQDPGAVVASHRHAPPAKPVVPPPTTQSRSQVLASFSGRGNQTTKRFSVRAGLRWQLRWAYRCPAGQRTGQFIVAGADRGPGELSAGTSIEESAPSGKGRTWLKAGGTRHALVVISTCTWTMQVVQTSLPRTVSARSRHPSGRAHIGRHLWARRSWQRRKLSWPRRRDPYRPSAGTEDPIWPWPWFGTGDLRWPRSDGADQRGSAPSDRGGSGAWQPR